MPDGSSQGPSLPRSIEFGEIPAPWCSPRRHGSGGLASAALVSARPGRYNRSAQARERLACSRIVLLVTSPPIVLLRRLGS
jgi:hypothetical protein